MGAQSNVIIFSPAYYIFGLVVLGLSIFVLIDTARLPAPAFRGTGLSKTSWIVLQAVLMLFCGIGALIMVFVWFLMKRPTVTAHAQMYGYGRQYYTRQPPGAMPPGSFPGQPGYGQVPPGGYGAAPPGSQFAQYGAGQPPPPPPEPFDSPRDAPPSDWAPPPPPSTWGEPPPEK